MVNRQSGDSECSSQTSDIQIIMRADAQSVIVLIILYITSLFRNCSTFLVKVWLQKNQARRREIAMWWEQFKRRSFSHSKLKNYSFVLKTQLWCLTSNRRIFFSKCDLKINVYQNLTYISNFYYYHQGIKSIPLIEYSGSWSSANRWFFLFPKLR